MRAMLYVHIEHKSLRRAGANAGVDYAFCALGAGEGALMPIRIVYVAALSALQS